jgi:hypothetical protein
MDKPILFPLEQSARVYEVLRNVRWDAECVEIPESLTSKESTLEQENYAKVLLAIRCVDSLLEGALRIEDSSPRAPWVFAKSAFDTLLELESLLAARVMTSISEDAVLAADFAEHEASKAKTAA